MVTKIQTKEKSIDRFQIVFDKLEQASYEAEAMAYVCLQLAKCNPDLHSRMIEKLRPMLKPIIESEKNGSYDFECEIFPVLEWTIFLDGFLFSRELHNGQSSISQK